MASLSAQAPPRPAISLTHAGSLGWTVWPADFNRDGRADLVGSLPGTSGGPGPLGVALGNGDGTFRPVTQISAAAMHVVTVGDFNADSRIDIIGSTANGADGWIFAGRGDGTFAAPVLVIDDIGPETLHAAAIDLDGNGTRDLAVTGGRDALDIYPGHGDLTFGPRASFATGLLASGLIAADFNNDSKLDVAVGTRYGQSIDVFLNQGGLLFAPSSIPFATPIAGVTAWDLNGDGNRELIAVSANANVSFDDDGDGEVFVLRGNGDGTFQPAVSHTTPNGPMYVVGGDFNRDGLADVATGNWSMTYDGICDGYAFEPDSVSILAGNGTGWLAPAVSFATGATPDDVRTSTVHSLKTADLNGDGRTDLVASGHVLMNAAAAANRLPLVNAGPDRPEETGAGAHVAGTASDPDHHFVRLTWTDESGAVIGDTPRVCIPGAYSGTETFTLTADDGLGGVSRDTVTLTFGSGSTDVGAVSAAGSMASNGEGGIVVRGSGADIWGSADEFFFAHSQPVAGDFDSWIRVDSVQHVHDWTKAGLMVRESYAPGSRHAFIFATPSAAKGVAFQRRPVTGGDSVHTAGPPTAPPAWLLLSRRGNTIRSYYAASETDTWALVGEQVFTALPTQLLLGLAVTSHVDGTLAAATFSGWSVSPPPLASADIGSVGLPGTTTSSPSGLRLTGSGADIWGAADAFRYYYQRVSGDAEISVRVDSLEAAHEWAKAGVMFRETLSPGSRHVMAIVSKSRGVSLQYRPSTNGPSLQAANAAGQAPKILRLQRVGDQFTAMWYEPGGPHVLATVTVPMVQDIYVGLPVTSHDNAALATAAFSQLFVMP